MFSNLLKCRVGVLNRIINVRTFLSDSYKLQEVWNSRLTTPIIKKVNLETLHYDIDQKLQQTGKINPIDVDIYANSVIDENHVDELADLIYKLRLTNETTNTLESTGHAIIRNLVDNNLIKQLITLLEDRLSNGIFLDDYSCNLVLDKLIKDNDFKSAAHIATIQMLQEDFTNDIMKYLSLYSCLKHLKNPLPFHEEVIVETKAEDVQVKSKSKKKKEEVRVRVKYLRNDYFDDHFDLKNDNHLVGKTLLTISNHLNNANNANNNSIKLLGLVLYEKYDECLKFIQNLKINDEIYEDCYQQVINCLQKHEKPEDKFYVEVKDTIETLKSKVKINNTNWENAVTEMIGDAIIENEQNDINNQKKIYDSWLKIREEQLNSELLRLERKKRLDNIQELTKNMEKEEQKLWYFENEDQIELAIDSKKVIYPKRWFGKKKKPRVVDEGYIPPEIRVNRN